MRRILSIVLIVIFSASYGFAELSTLQEAPAHTITDDHAVAIASTSSMDDQTFSASDYGVRSTSVSERCTGQCPGECVMTLPSTAVVMPCAQGVVGAYFVSVPTFAAKATLFRPPINWV